MKALALLIPAVLLLPSGCRKASASEPVDVDAVTVGEALADYWGEAWEDARSRLSADCDLDQPLAPGVRIDWASVEPGFREIIAGRAEGEGEERVRQSLLWRTAEGTVAGPLPPLKGRFNPGGRQLAVQERDELRTLVESLDAEIASVALVFQELLEEAEADLWSRGDYLAMPLCSCAPPGFAQGGCYSATISHSGWSVTYSLERELYPALAATIDDLDLLRHERDRAVITFLTD